MTIIEKSIIQKVKDAIQVDYEIESTELYDLLYDYRNAQHPDRYTDDELKKKAEEKFKELNNLLGLLSKFIELEKQQRKPNELIPFQKSYEITKIKQSGIWQDEEIEKLKKDSLFKDEKIEFLLEEIDKLRNEEQNKIKIELVNSYKPSKKSFIYSGISVLLIVAYSLMTKSEQIFDLLQKYSPIDTKSLNTVFFVTLIVILLSLLKKLYEERIIKKVYQKVIGPLIIRDFYQIIPFAEENRYQTFSEIFAYEYIVDRFSPKNEFTRWVFTKIFPIYTEITFIQLKDIFIYHMLEKHLIELHCSENLDRFFKIKRQYFHF